MTETLEPMLVPELLVADLDQSIDFRCNLCGFEIAYSRPEERFAYITLGSAHLMLEQAGVGRNWITGPLERPLGRGMNLRITVPDSDALAQVRLVVRDIAPSPGRCASRHLAAASW